MQTRVWNACIVKQYEEKVQKPFLPMQTRVWNACILTPYQGKGRNSLNRCRHAFETHALWRHTKENVEVVLTDADTRVKTDALWHHTKENVEIVLTDADTRVKRMHCNAIRRKTQKPS